MAMNAHHPECLCTLCERVGGGVFAQRAVLRGDSSAASQLGSAVYEFLSAQRARRRPRTTSPSIDAAGERAS